MKEGAAWADGDGQQRKGEGSYDALGGGYFMMFMSSGCGVLSSCSATGKMSLYRGSVMSSLGILSHVFGRLGW